MANIFPMPVVTFDRFIELAIVLPAEPIDMYIDNDNHKKENDNNDIDIFNISNNSVHNNIAPSQSNHHASFYTGQTDNTEGNCSGSETEEDEETHEIMIEIIISI